MAGATRVVTLDLHSPQIQGFFQVPVDNLYAMPVLCDRIRAMGLENLVVVAPDAGFAKHARRYARYLQAPSAIADKERLGHDETAQVLEIIGDVRGKTAVIVDDFTITARTLTLVAEQLMDRGATAVYATVTHAVFAPGSMERLDESPLVKLLVTDSVENQPVPFSPKVEMVSVAPLLGEAIRRIHHRESISVMFGS
jgi:ribose-phosphate pyrophosphokinase